MFATTSLPLGTTFLTEGPPLVSFPTSAPGGWGAMVDQVTARFTSCSCLFP